MQITIKAKGLDEVKERMRLRAEKFQSVMADAMQEIKDESISILNLATPVGADGGGSNPPGDGPGRLRDSYKGDITSSATHAKLVIRTTQPTKMKYVTKGRGPVRPVRKKALYWKGLPHPVCYSGPSRANDFITPHLKKVETRAILRMKAKIHEAMQ